MNDGVSRYQLIVLTRAKPGRRAEFERWYDEQHIPDCLRVPGVVAAERYALVHAIGTSEEGLPSEPAVWDSLAIYHFKTDDPLALARDMIGRAGTAEMPASDALDRASIVKAIATKAGR